MCINSETYIQDSKSFQKCGEYDLAIDSLFKARSADIERKNEIEIHKLLSYNFRKLGQFEQALLHINYALNAAQNSSQKNGVEAQEPAQLEYAICLMNKGIVFEEMGQTDKALGCYLPALEVFLRLYEHDLNIYGIVINALLTIGTLYYNDRQFSESTKYLKMALSFFESETGKEDDRRYIAIINTLNTIKD